MSLFSDIAGLAAINTAYNKLGSVGDRAFNESVDLAFSLYNRGQFQPFTVTSGIGSSGISEGGVSQNLIGPVESLQSSLFSRSAENLFGQTEGANLAGITGGDLLSRVTGTLDQPIPGYSPLTQATNAAISQGMGFMQQAGMPVGAREQQVFDRIRAAQQPEEERRRLELEERLATQGRLGVSTNLYGGTPEQLALSKAQAEAQNTAMLQAMQQARAEQAQAGALGQQFTSLGGTLSGQLQNLQTAQQARGLGFAQTGLGLMQGREALEASELQQSIAALKGGLLPEAAQLNMLQQGLNAAKLREQSQQFRTGLFGEAGVTGIDALLASGLGQASLVGNVGAGVLAAGAQSSDGGLFDFIKNIFKVS
jgi:hypothetical protein